MSTAMLRSPTRRPLPPRPSKQRPAARDEGTIPDLAAASGASLEFADRQVSGEHRLTGITRQPRVGFGRHLGAIAGLLQLHHGVATGYAAGRLSLRLRKLRLELPDDSHQNRRRAPVGLLSDAPDLERVGAAAFIAAGTPPISVLRMGGTGRATR